MAELPKTLTNSYVVSSAGCSCNPDHLQFNAAGSRAAADPTATELRDISVSIADFGFSGPVKVRDLWNHKDLGVTSGTLTRTVNSHGAGVYRVRPKS